MSDKSLLEQWRATAYDQSLSKTELENFWSKYFTIEKDIYVELLKNPDEEVRGTLKEVMKKQRNVFTENKNSQEQSVKRKKLEEMIHVHVEVEKNIKNVVDVISNCA